MQGLAGRSVRVRHEVHKPGTWGPAVVRVTQCRRRGGCAGAEREPDQLQRQCSRPGAPVLALLARRGGLAARQPRRGARGGPRPPAGGTPLRVFYRADQIVCALDAACALHACGGWARPAGAPAASPHQPLSGQMPLPLPETRVLLCMYGVRRHVTSHACPSIVMSTSRASRVTCMRCRCSYSEPYPNPRP